MYHRVEDDSGERFTQETNTTLQVSRAGQDNNSGAGRREDINKPRLLSGRQDSQDNWTESFVPLDHT